jgi:hypothetical protein
MFPNSVEKTVCFKILPFYCRRFWITWASRVATESLRGMHNIQFINFWWGYDIKNYVSIKKSCIRIFKLDLYNHAM